MLSKQTSRAKIFYFSSSAKTLFFSLTFVHDSIYLTLCLAQYNDNNYYFVSHESMWHKIIAMCFEFAFLWSSSVYKYVDEKSNNIKYMQV